MTSRDRNRTAAAFVTALLPAMLYQATPAGTTARNAPAGAATCESLSGLKLPNTTITMAQVMAPGSFTPPAPVRAATPGPETAAAAGRAGRGINPAQVYAGLGSFCRVAATLAPSSDSTINIEVWMPSSGWNGKFEAV